MKKLQILFALILAFSIVSLGSINIVNAETSAEPEQTILIGQSNTDDSKSVRAYKIKKGKMVATKKRVSMVEPSKKWLRYYKATKVTFDGKSYWKLAKNKYIKDSYRINPIKHDSRPQPGQEK
ncbi:hypothetical protein [Companilactobacillus mishanensis]|uniref:Surface layer protein A domain-containing protein n=1 Tax=Companilactobacillus mishanensis TaxID=2486008 RepID=A0ABW9P8R4_9LACO|nr:hypothetical protein [Companilactobacillus mishanensis]MQS45552.1 hypothetical protein [Companilactobacillus mishanensis]